MEKLKEALLQACSESIKVARSYIEDELPEEFLLFLEDNGDTENGVCTVDEALVVLYRDGRIPKWIDINVKNIINHKTLLRCIYSNEFIDDSTRLYHKDKGNPPFHVVGPYLPSKIAIKNIDPRTNQQVEKFSILEMPDRV